MQDVVLSPTDFVALVNQTLEFAYPNVVIEGELCNFRIAKNRWIYFSLKDEVAQVEFFGSVYQLPGPLEEGMKVRALGNPRLHTKFGFSVNVINLSPVGEGSIKKAADLVAAKLYSEGLFELSRKRALPAMPSRLGLITAAGSAAYHDFIKILGERWSGATVLFADAYVQGDQAPASIIKAIEHMNQLAEPPEVLVITRGGGSVEDLAAFNDERVVRAVAASRIPTIVAVGHEIDESLAELAADIRASTPSNAAQLATPDKKHEQARLAAERSSLLAELLDIHRQQTLAVQTAKQNLSAGILAMLNVEKQRLVANRRLVALFNPEAALKRGYAIVRKNSHIVSDLKQVSEGDTLNVVMRGGTLKVKTQEVKSNGG